MMRNIICPICGKEFTASSYKRKYCSLNCARKADCKLHNDAHKERVRNNNHKGYYSKTIIELYEGKCAICGWQASKELLTVDGRTQYAHGNEIHHIEPVKNGGGATIENLILLCPNHHKQADLGIISKDELRQYLKAERTPEEKKEMQTKSIDRVSDAIFFYC